MKSGSPNERVGEPLYRQALDSDVPSVQDDELVLAADQIFLDLDRREGLVRLLGGSDERLDP